MNTKPQLSMIRILCYLFLVVLGGFGCRISSESFLPQIATQTQENEATPLSGTQTKPNLVIIEYTSDEGGYGYYYPADWQIEETGINARFVTATSGIEGESVARLLTAVGAGEIPNEYSPNFERIERGDTVILREDILGSDNQIIGRNLHVIKNERWYRVSLTADPTYAGSSTMTNYLAQMEIIFESLYFLPETLTQSIVGSTGLRLESSIERYIYDTRMAGLAPTFVLAGYKHSIDPRVMVALASTGSKILENSQEEWCGSFNPWGEMGTGTCMDFSSWEEAIDYVAARLAEEAVQHGHTSLADFADGSETAWCTVNCDRWLKDAHTALGAMGEQQNGQDLSFSAALQDFGGAPVNPPSASGDDAQIKPTSTPIPTATPTVTPTPTQTFTPVPETSIPGQPVANYPRLGQVLPYNEYVLMRWLPADHATEYKVELWGGPFASPIVYCDWNAATTCSFGSHKYPGTKIYWRVMARNEIGQESAWSDQWWFTWAYPPASN
jgi:hypothetical protein